jgi:hypothetical protein
VAEDAPIDEGTPVEITSIKGLTLTVRRAPGGDAQPEPG